MVNVLKGKHLFSFLLTICILFSSCKNMNKATKGAIIGTAGGAAAGALIGKAAGNTAVGAIAGAAIGGTAGYLIGRPFLITHFIKMDYWRPDGRLGRRRHLRGYPTNRCKRRSL